MTPLAAMPAPLLAFILSTLCLLLSTAGGTRAQGLPPGVDETFPLATLDPALALDADAVVRLDYLSFEAESPGRAVQRVRRVVTVLAPDGRPAGELYIPYDDRLRHLKALEGVVRDARGKVVRKLKKDDQEDYSNISGYTLYEESRVRVARLYHDAYPYTVDYAYEVRFEGVISWPTWYPQEGYPVERSLFEISAPEDLAVRYHAAGGLPEPRRARQGGRQLFAWEATAQPAFEEEPLGPSWSEQAPAVHTAPARFEIEGAAGDMASWEAFARWYGGLSEGRDALPPEAVAEVAARTAGLTDDRAKVERLYRYLQETTRYVSIQLGLGGWQPFDAAHVHRHGYGDCKALTNYMRALLKAAGIPSFPALIRSGSEAPEVLSVFPSNQFNHVVLYVPPGAAEADPLWLECTSQTMPFGHLGASNEDRYALVVEPGGGRLVRTPRSLAAENRQVRRAEVTLTAAGDATAEVTTRYTGDQQDHVRQALAGRPGREREEWLHERIGLPSFEVVHADFSGVDGQALEVSLPMGLRLPRYAARTGSRLFLPLMLMDRWSFIPPDAGGRTQPVELFPYAFTDADTVHYRLPDGFAVEALPAPVAVEAPFGRYHASVTVEPAGGLTYVRTFEMTEPTLPADQYGALREFLRQVAQADRAQVVLVAQD